MIRSEPPKVVFDTMILCQATAQTTGPAAALFTCLEDGHFILWLFRCSGRLIQEIRHKSLIFSDLRRGNGVASPAA